MTRWLTLLLLFGATLLAAQDLPTPIVGHAFCKSGVENGAPGRGLVLEYFLHPSYDLQGQSTENGEKAGNDVDNRKFIEAKIKLPLVNTDPFKWLIGFGHTYEKYDFDDISARNNFLFESIDDVPLRRTRFSTILFRSLNEKNYVALRLGASFNGNYRGLVDFESRYSVYRAAAIWGFKKDPYRELAVGLTYNNSFNRTLVLPFFLWNRTFNEKWGLESIMPLKVNVRRNFTKTSLLLVGYEYWSSAYSMDIQGPDDAMLLDYHFRSSAVHFSVDYQKRLATEWTWVGLKAGWAWNFDSRFTRTTDDQDFQAFPSNSFFISFSFFVSPPERVRQELEK